MSPHTVWVETVDGDIELSAATEFTFGRGSACTFQVDDSDRNISAVAGSIAFNGTSWVLTNRSSSRSLELIDEDARYPFDLLPGRDHRIQERRLRVRLMGRDKSHFEFTVVMNADEPSARGTIASSGSGSTLGPPELSDSLRLDLAALLWEYYDVPATRKPRPLSYAVASQMRGCGGKALEHRISALRIELLKQGYQAIEDNYQLAQFMITIGAIGTPDFERLADLQR